jgi:hypothetical protein
MVAIIRLDGRMVRDDHTGRMRPMFKGEIAERIGCTDATVTAVAGRAGAAPGRADAAPAGRRAVAGRAPRARGGATPATLIANLTARL